MSDQDDHLMPVMSEAEAREAVTEVQQSAMNIGRRLLELRERQGWKVLGYHSFTAMLRGEFTYSRQHLYRLMSAERPPELLSHNVTPLSSAERMTLAEAEATLSAYKARMDEGYQAALAMRDMLLPKGLWESTCKEEFDMSGDELLESLKWSTE